MTLFFFTSDPQHCNGHTSYGPHWQAPCHGCHRSQIPSFNQGCTRNQQKTLNHYYDKTDHSEVYRITMSMWFAINVCFSSYILLVLHPQHKLRYFKNAGWPDEWFERAEEIVIWPVIWILGCYLGPATCKCLFISAFRVLFFRPPLSHPHRPYLKTSSIIYVPFKHPSHWSCRGNLISTWVLILLMFLMLQPGGMNIGMCFLTSVGWP